MQSNIVGRALEQALLNKALQSNQAEFIAVYGRRRVGKTFLISTFLQDKGVYFEFTGIKDGDLTVHLKSFIKELKSFTTYDTKRQPKDWFDALELLLEQVKQTSKDKKIILFFDELPWIASPKSNFLSALDNLWNRHLSRMNNVILIVCGSAASWMIDNIISNTGGLYNRLTRKIHLLPFTLAETKLFLSSRNIHLDVKQIVELYMAMGGIPKYLLQVEPGKSVTQIINEQFFFRTGYLMNEFNNLYSSLFKNSAQHIKVIKILAKNNSGFTRTELLDKAGIGTGGTASKILRELEECGFILSVNNYSTKKSLSKYRLIDQYSLFYLKWVETNERASYLIEQKNYWIQQANTNSWQIWCGYAFENICLLHINNIQQALGISGIQVTAHSWLLKGAANKQGAQIDLILDRADNCINLCEIKYYNQEFELTKKYVQDLEKKKEIFRTETSCKKSLFTTFITTYGVIENTYAKEYIQNHITINDLFL